MKIVFASNNEGKIRELNALLSSFDIEVVPQTLLGVTEVEETELTFIENALIKARHASRVTGLPALADDSGLEVDALHGAPGIFSARYAGKNATSQDNIQKLLNAMKSLKPTERGGAFHCTLVFLMFPEDPTPLICQGTWKGVILTTPTGTEGFGYDPIFYDENLQCSAAQLPLDVKNKISHRGQALQLFLKKLPEKIHASTLR